MIQSHRTGPSDNSAILSSHERILEAAKRMFAANGYENTSTVAIARAAGSSESQLMKHFGSKEGLLETIFERGWARMAQNLAEARNVGSCVEKLQKLFSIIIDSLEKDEELKLLMLLEGRRIRKGGRMVLLTQGYMKTVRLVDSILAEMRSRRQLQSGVKPPCVRSALIGIFEGLLRDHLLALRAGFPAEYSAADIRKTFNFVLAAFCVPRTKVPERESKRKRFARRR